MSDDLNDMIGAAAEGATKGLAEKGMVVYDDLIKPGASVLGKGIGNTLKILLLPLTLTFWSVEKITNMIDSDLTNRLNGVDPEALVAPPIAIVGPALEAMRYLEDEAELRNLYAQLIASSMQNNLQPKVHRGFIEVLKNMNIEDAFVLKWFHEFKFLITYNIDLQNGSLGFVSVLERDINCSLHKKGKDSITNLLRLGLIETGPFINSPGKQIDQSDRVSELRQKYGNLLASQVEYLITTLGERFCEVCM
jgi:hypothetical protein